MRIKKILGTDRDATKVKSPRNSRKIIENTMKHKCEICGKRFKIEVDLETHYADVHEMTDEDLDEMISLNDDYKCEEILSQKNQSAS